LVDFEVADAFIVSTIEVCRPRNARFNGSVREGLQDFPSQALLFNAPLATVAMQVREATPGSALWICAVIQSIVIFMGFEVR